MFIYLKLLKTIKPFLFLIHLTTKLELVFSFNRGNRGLLKTKQIKTKQHFLTINKMLPSCSQGNNAAKKNNYTIIIEFLQRD